MRSEQEIKDKIAALEIECSKYFSEDKMGDWHVVVGSIHALKWMLGEDIEL